MSRRLDLSRIHRDYFAAFAFSPAGVNMGWCFVWAWLAKLELERRGHQPELVCLEYVSPIGWCGAHAAVFCEGRYYDSQSPRGVLWPESLQLSKRMRCQAAVVSEKRFTLLGFKRVWNRDHWADISIRPWPKELPPRARIEPCAA